MVASLERQSHRFSNPKISCFLRNEIRKKHDIFGFTLIICYLCFQKKAIRV